MGFVRKGLNLSKRVVNYLENAKIPFVYFVLTFVFILTLRTFLELFSDSDSVISLLAYMHYYSFWIALAVALTFVFHLVTQTDLIKVARVVLTSFIFVLIAPILDLIISGGKGYNIAYMIPGVHENLLMRFFTFFGDMGRSGISPGVKIEIALILLLSFVYFYLKLSSVVKSLLSWKMK